MRDHTWLASGSRHVCEFLESETALGETTTEALPPWRRGRTDDTEDTLSPDRWDEANDKLRKDDDEERRSLRSAAMPEEEEKQWGGFKAPTAAIDSYRGESAFVSLKETELVKCGVECSGVW